MTRRIHKYMLPFADHSTLELPAGATIIHATMSDGVYGDVTIWALVDRDAPLETRGFRLAGTGHDIDEPVTHIATMLQPVPGMHPLVWHLFGKDGV